MVDAKEIAENIQNSSWCDYEDATLLATEYLRLRAENEALKWAQGEANAEKRRAEGLFNSNSTLRLQITDLTRQRDEALGKWSGQLQDFLGIPDTPGDEGMMAVEDAIHALTTRAETAERQIAAMRNVIAELVNAIGECNCHESYKARDLVDPECSFCDNEPEIRAALAALSPTPPASPTT